MSQLLQEDIELFRPIFIENLKRFKDEQIIKILCGVRRCGKSTILESYKNELLSLGVKSCNIIQRLYLLWNLTLTLIIEKCIMS